MNRYGFDKHLAEMGVLNGDKILVAVSGGVDSMCLLHGLFHSSLALHCSVAHVNFHLRGEESNLDEVMVREWCMHHQIELFVKDVDTVGYAKEHSISIEMAARDLRYGWFGELMQENGFRFLAIAHHANDNAETLLLNLVRGTGIKGLCGIAAKNGDVIRPLLCYTREQIEKYILHFKIPYRVDHTNLESDYARNRVRNEVFPQLAKINPSVIQTFNRDIQYFSMANSILENIAQQKKEQLCREGFGGAQKCICVEELLQDEHWQYWLYTILQGYGFRSAQMEDVAAAILGGEVKRYLSGSHVVVKERGMLKIYPASLLEPVPDHEIVSAGVLNFGGLEISLEIKENSPEVMLLMHNRENGLFIAADHLAFPLKCRTMIAGDKFSPFGMKGMKKVSDFLTDIKTDHILRNRVPLLLNGDEKTGSQIICLPGLRIDSRYMVTAKTEKVLVVKTRF